MRAPFSVKKELTHVIEFQIENQNSIHKQGMSLTLPHLIERHENNSSYSK